MEHASIKDVVYSHLQHGDIESADNALWKYHVDNPQDLAVVMQLYEKIGMYHRARDFSEELGFWDKGVELTEKLLEKHAILGDDKNSRYFLYQLGHQAFMIGDLKRGGQLSSSFGEHHGYSPADGYNLQRYRQKHNIQQRELALPGLETSFEYAVNRRNMNFSPGHYRRDLLDRLDELPGHTIGKISPQ